MDNEENFGLNYKVHNQVFSSLNQEKEDIGKLYEYCTIKFGYVPLLHTKLKSLFLRYHPYFKYKKDEIRTMLGETSQLLNDSKYQMDLQSGNKIPTKYSIRQESKIRAKLEEIFYLITEELVNSELLPKPVSYVEDEDEF